MKDTLSHISEDTDSPSDHLEQSVIHLPDLQIFLTGATHHHQTKCFIRLLHAEKSALCHLEFHQSPNASIYCEVLDSSV